MIERPIGLSTGCFYRTSIFDCLEPIRQTGFEIIEISSAPAHLDYHDRTAVRRAAREIHDLELEPHSFHAPYRDEIDITALDAARRRRSRGEIVRAMEAAAELGVQRFVLHPGPEEGGHAPDERLPRLENAAAVITEVAGSCRQMGMELVIENMLPHLFAGHISNLLWILGALRTAQVGICLDTGHAHLAGGDDLAVEKVAGHLRMLHASDNHGKQDEHLPPGDGSIAWRRLLHQLDAVDFAGTIIIELGGDGEREQVLAGARRGRRFLHDLARELARSERPR